MGPRFSVTRLPAAFLLSILLINFRALPQTAADTEVGHKHVMARHLLEKGIPNFAEVSPTLYRGGQPSEEGLKKLAKMGIDIVIDARGTERSAEGKAVRKSGMKYVAIPWHCPFPHDDVFVRFLSVLRDNPGKKVFVHCRLGDDRTGMMIAAYRITDEGWTTKQALDEMEKFGFTDIHHMICPRLQAYEKHFPEHLKNNPEFKHLRENPPAAKSN
jgi:protein tyrosine/serine phosphatase